MITSPDYGGAEAGAKEDISLPHVVHVGLYHAERPFIDFVGNAVTALVREENTLISHPSSRLGPRRVGKLQIRDADDLDAYDEATAQMIQYIEDFSSELGSPSAVVGLYEHTTLPAARLRERFNVPGTSVHTATLCRDKVAMKEAISKVGIPVPRFWSVDGFTDLDDLARELMSSLTGRVVLKPRSQAGSYGVTLFDSVASLMNHARTAGIGRGYEVEEYIDGAVCHFDGVVRDGEVRFLSVSRYIETCLSYRNESTSLASVTLTDPTLFARANSFTQRILSAIGLVDSAFHLEAFLTSTGEFIFLEIANRFGGAGIRWHINEVYNVDLLKESLLACLNKPSELPPATDRGGVGTTSSGWLYMPSIERGPREVLQITGLEDLPGSVRAMDLPEIGDLLDPATEVWSSTGRFVVEGLTEAGVENDLKTISTRYGVILKPIKEEI